MISTMANQRSNSKLVKTRRACRLECMSTDISTMHMMTLNKNKLKQKKKGSRAQIQAPPTLSIVR